MAEKVEVEVVAKTDKAVKALNNLENKLEEVSKVGQKNREGFKVLDQATGGYAGKIKELSASVKGVITGAKGFIKTLKGVKGALISTGIGALVVALGLIVAYWDDIKGLVDGTTRAQREGLAEAEKLRDVTQEQLNIINSMENTLKAQGKTEKEIRDLKIQQTNEVIAATEAQLAQQEAMKKSQTEAAERNRNIAAGIIAFLTAPVTIILGMVDAISQTLAQLGVIEEGTSLAEDFVLGAAEMIFDPEEVATEADATIKETEAQLRKLKNTRDGYILQEQKDRESQAEKRKADKKKEDDAEIQAEKDKNAALERIRKGLIDTEAEERAEKLRLIQADYDEQIKLAEKYYGEETEKVKELREAQRLALEAQQLTFDEQDQQKRVGDLELGKDFDEATFEEQRAILAQKREELLNDETLTEEQKLELTKQYKAADKKLDDIEFAGKKKQQAEAMDLANKAQALAGKNTVAGKAIGIATATVNTFQGASEALKQKSSLPSPFDVVAKVANVATVLATGLKTVKSIASVKVPGGGGGGGTGAVPSGGGSVAAPAPPSFNVVGATETSVLADTVAEQTQEPVQAYVVSNDITTAQSLENNIVEGATL